MKYNTNWVMEATIACTGDDESHVTSNSFIPHLKIPTTNIEKGRKAGLFTLKMYASLNEDVFLSSG